MQNPPVADKVLHTSDLHNQTLEDYYAWMRDAKWPTEVTDKKIISYLEQENTYSKQFFDKHLALKEQIFEELKGRIQLKDQSPYIKRDNYYYYTRIEADQNYPIYCRKHGSTEASEEILLDVNKLAQGKTFVRVRGVSLSPDQKLMAYGVDFAGNEKYTIKILNLETQKYLVDEILDTDGDTVWHNHLPLFFYTPIKAELTRDSVMMHTLGSKDDVLVFHESNPIYSVGTAQSNSRKYMFIHNSGHEDNELLYIDLDLDDHTPRIVLPRKHKVLYTAEHNGNDFYISTNDVGNNFRIVKLKIGTDQVSEYIPESKDQYLSSYDLTDQYIILNYKQNGLSRIVVRDLSSGLAKDISFPDAAYTASGSSTNFKENDIRIDYSSLGRPYTTYLYDFGKNSMSILKETIIPSGFNSSDYQVERVWVDNNGTKIPVSLFYKKSLFKKDGSNPLYLYGYGSYGMAMEPAFRNSAVTLADRGFVFAIAHIRGGDDLGRNWYEAAKFLTKKLTFEDFIACSEYLINQKYTSKGDIVICGGSAGGMLIGAVVNARPELYKAAIMHVPFVDVLNTMLDETLSLTPGEFKEWGNPKEPEYFEYIKSYSPYDNITKQHYPHLFVTAGISDPRVAYWEASKWVAKLRDYKTDDHLLLLKTNMDSGHQGASGRFDYLKEVAEDYVFIFTTFGLSETVRQ